jgi:SAM-dependent methyltransferase
MPAGEPYLTPYRDMVGRVGASFASLLWTSRQTQAARFQAIAEMIDLRGRTVLDAGCGLGDLAAHLHRRGIAYRRYLGVDALEPHIAAGRARALPRAVFRLGDFVADPAALTSAAGAPAPEVILFSGSLNTLEPAVVQTVLERAWRACSWALVFNFLCRQGPGRPRCTGPIRRLDPAAMLAWAARRTPLVTYRQDYLQGDEGGSRDQ